MSRHKEPEKKTTPSIMDPKTRMIGRVTFACYETGQVCTMEVNLTGENLSLVPYFKLPVKKDTPISVTMELWNRWTGRLVDTFRERKE